MTTATIPSDPSIAGEITSYLRVVAGPKPGARLLEIRFALRHGDMGRVFLAAHSAAGAARFIRRLGRRTDVYVGAVLRNRRSGGRNAIDRSHLVFVEMDSPDAQERLETFAHPPTMLVATGIICSHRSRGPECVGDGCWRRVADTACATDGIRWCRGRR